MEIAVKNVLVPQQLKNSVCRLLKKDLRGEARTFSRTITNTIACEAIERDAAYESFSAAC